MSNTLENRWFELFSHYSDDTLFLKDHFEIVLNNYRHSSRYYHNEQHIETMLWYSETYKGVIEDRWTLDVAIFFHDVIYDATRKDNELKSALYATNFLSLLKLQPEIISEVKCLIESTSKHCVLCERSQLNAWLLDIDLSILGAEWETYYAYTKNIRKEYSIYPDFLYKRGRKKVLKNFLDREQIFFTNEFYASSETIARANLVKELNML